MSLTIGDIINGASDPSQAISNFVGNLQVGGGNPAPAVSTQPQQNAYQFQGNPSGPGLQMPQTTPAAPAPVAPVAPAVSALPQAMQMPSTQPMALPSTQPMAPTNYNPAPSAPPRQIQPQLNAMPAMPAMPSASEPAMPAMPPATTTPVVAPQPQAQPVSYNPNAAPANPIAPQQSATPNLYPGMIQAESNGQNFNAQGEPLTSPKGAMFAAQVMPATANKPGFGITPAQSQTPEEYNRVGREYYNAMYKKFNSDPYKAAAAYNAGPGRVLQAEKQAQENGGDYRDYLPAETQQYLKKLQGMNHAEISTTSIQTRPDANTSDDMQKTMHVDYALTNQNNIPELTRVAYDANAHPEAKRIAGTIAADRLSHDENTRQAERQGENLIAAAGAGDIQANKQLASAISGQGKDEGSYLKAYLYHRFGLSQLAQQEQIKLGAGATYQTVNMSDGTDAIVKMRADGQAINGIDRATGQPLTAKQLQDATGLYQKGAETGKTMYTDAQGHTVTVTSNKGQTGLTYKDETTGTILKGAPAGLRPLSEQDPVTKHAIDTSTSVMNALRKQNEVLGGNYYNEDYIQQAGAKAANAVYSQFGRTPPKSTVTTSQENLGGTAVIPHGQTEVAPSISGAPSKTTEPEVGTQAYYNAHPEVRRPTDTPTSFKARQTINPEGIEAEAKMIAGYDKDLPKTGSSSYRQELMRKVQELNPEYDQKKFAQANDAIKKFTTGAEGKTVRAANTFIDHTNSLKPAIDALANSNYPLINKYANEFAIATGQPAPTDFEAMKRVVGDELVKAITGSAGALADRDEVARSLNAANSPTALKSVLNRYTQLMAGQVKSLKKEYEEAGLKDFDKKLLPRTKQELQKVNEESNSTRSKW